MHPLLARILDSPWLISPQVAQQYLPMLVGLQDGHMPDMRAGRNLAELRAEMQPQDYVLLVSASGQASAAVPAAGSQQDAQGQASTDRCQVRVVSLSGPLMKDDQECGPLGMSTFARYIQSAGQNPDIDALVLKIDSPGGQVYGTQSLADAIKNCGKPVVALCDDGLMCSAAYWIGSAASAILATHETCVIGSIGVMASWADKQGKLEKEGVVFHEVYASQSTQKNADFAAAKTGDYGPMQERLSAICDQFIGAVSANRGERLDQKAAKKAGALAGATFHAAEAQELGLIDGIGSLQDAFALCASLVQEQRATSPASSSASSTTTSSKMGLFANSKLSLGAAMMALVGAETVTTDMATAANAELAAAGITGAALITATEHGGLVAKGKETSDGKCASCGQTMPKEGKASAESMLASMTEMLTSAGAADVAALVASRDEWKTKAESFGSQAGTMGTNAKKEAVDVSEGTAASAAQKAIDELPHNMALDSNPLFAGRAK